MKQVIILGNGGHAKSISDIIEQLEEYEVIGMVVNNQDENGGDYPILGSDNDLEALYEKGYRNAVIGIGYLGNSDLRERLYNKLKSIGYSLPIIIDPSATIANNVKIEEGTIIAKRAVVNTGSYIGKMSIINTGAIIEHECQIGDFSHIAVGAVLCGNVDLGAGSFVGANTTIVQEIKIKEKSFIRAGTLIKEDIE